MKRKKLLFSLFTLLVLSFVGALTFLPKIESNESKDEINKEKSEEEGAAGAQEFLHRQLANFQTGEIEVDKILAAKKAARNISSSKSLNLTWQEMGPNNVGGRVRAILVDKNNEQHIYAGGVDGGLWESTTGGLSWVQIPLDGNIAVVSICQAPNGSIFVGTGEGLVQPAATNHNSGALGDGIYRKLAGENHFSHLSATDNWRKVNRLAADINGNVYAATGLGLFKSTDNGTSWTRIKMGTFNDVKASTSLERIVATTGGRVYISDDGSVWKVAHTPTSGARRVEVAISASNPDVIYAVIAATDGSLKGIYRTIYGIADSTWRQIGVGGSSSLDLFGANKQGWYDIAVLVNTANPDIVYVGGIDLWKGVKVADNLPFSWTKKTLWNANVASPIYLHADQHAYVAVPSNPDAFFVGCDGGVAKTSTGANSFATLNRNFNVTQFYAVAPHANGGAIGGCQDNGTQFIDLQGNNPEQARKVRGGDGGWSATSMLNQQVIFASIYFANVGRSKDFGQTFQDPKDPATGDPEFYSSDMLTGLGGAFVTPIALWETVNFPNSEDSVYFVADTNYVAGDTIDGRSRINNSYPFSYRLSQNLSTGDTIRIADPVQSRLFIGTTKGIWMTKQSLYFAKKTPTWYLVSRNKYAGTAVWNIQVSRDGDVVYYAINNNLLRLSNLLQAQGANADVRNSTYVLQDTLLKSFPGEISSISIDPADANRITVTLGGTGNEHVYYSSNATSAHPTFASKKGNLPAGLPVYASLIPLNNSNQVIIGTQYGIYSTENINTANPVWSKSEDGISGMVTVYMLSQQQNHLDWRRTVIYDHGNAIVQVYPGVYNYGQIYAATHGRGIFTSKSYMSIEDKKISKSTQLSRMKLYPNPVRNKVTFEFSLNKPSSIKVNVFDITGRMVKYYDLGVQNAGNNKSNINLSELSAGTYILQLQTKEGSFSKKFIKR